MGLKMFFDNRDDISEILHTMKAEFEDKDGAEFIKHKLCTYHEIDFEIVRRYLEKFKAWVRNETDHQAEIVTRHRSLSTRVSSRDMFTDISTDTYEQNVYYDVFIVWTGKLPNRYI